LTRPFGSSDVIAAIGDTSDPIYQPLRAGRFGASSCRQQAHFPAKEA
jgi:hypothetical protein